MANLQQLTFEKIHEEQNAKVMDAILVISLQYGCATQAQVAEHTGLPRHTITWRFRDLKRVGAIYVRPERQLCPVCGSYTLAYALTDAAKKGLIMW